MNTKRFGFLPVLLCVLIFTSGICYANAQDKVSGSKWRVDSSGWAREKGDAKIRNLESVDEDGAPTRFLIEGEGEVEIDYPKRFLKTRGKRSKGDSDDTNTITFYEIRVSPSLGKKDNVIEKIPTIDMGGAVMGLRIAGETEGARMAELVAWVGSKSNGKKRVEAAENWIRTGIYFDVSESGYISGHIPIVVRVDEISGIWDLYVFGNIVLADLPYSKRSENFLIESVAKEKTSVRGVRVTDKNPLFVDENSDGIPDSFAERHGGIKRSEIVEETGSSLLVEYMSRPRG
ncbi:hypothetical protein VDG1235_3762 [Verrucomicrobiia bacterium DG1235]|nr:hypothetical protein VDG1235_3762 [Verrucomicrobiae bacterium DG1235]